ncbi:uncharacterized protein N7459_006964 [Penicillium hispanicum]|uniref:uncharacterized protein n=1 Tax=Penicillium hispanicum TaxID=1080232 RepID=UPI00254199C6|nr:uncharacterized protein N7459_006964 [Penicillium hispanicum]KAJ5578000.1 hypothetical protein N7459_006964 [Penicillium hispanicum]
MAMSLRGTVQTPLTPIAIRPDHITEFERLLYVDPKYASQSADEYKIKYDNNDRVLFTVTGQKYSSRRVREFRDPSGLPMFECERKARSPLWGRPWRVCLPGSDDEDLIYIKQQGPSGLDFTFRNAAATDSKTDEEKMVTAELRRKANAWCAYMVHVGGRKVVDIRDSVERNRTLPGSIPGVNGVPMAPPRRIVEILVADGVDLALVRWFILLHAFKWMYGG